LADCNSTKNVVGKYVAAILNILLFAATTIGQKSNSQMAIVQKV
jgi:hypothetical protein